MIYLINACRHRVRELPSKKIFLRPTTLSLPTSGRTAILSSDASAIPALVRLITGQLRLSTGKIVRNAILSPPIGKLSNVPAVLTPYQAVQFASRLYDVEATSMLASLMLLTDIEEYIDVPLNEVPPKFRGRFNHALWMTIKFNCYIFFQKVNLSGDPEFIKRADVFMEHAMKNCGFLLFTSIPKYALQSCNRGIVYHDSTLIPFEDTKTAVEFMKS